MDSKGEQKRKRVLVGVIVFLGLVFAGLLLYGLAAGCLLSESMETNISKEWPVVVLMALLTYPPLYSKRVRRLLRERDRDNPGSAYAGLMFACLIFWMFFSEGICVRFDVFPDAPRRFEAVVLDKTMHNSVTRYVTVRDASGGVHQLRMHEMSPEVGRPVVFAAREGLLGVLYDIEYIND